LVNEIDSEPETPYKTDVRIGELHGLMNGRNDITATLFLLIMGPLHSRSGNLSIHSRDKLHPRHRNIQPTMTNRLAIPLRT